MTISPALQAFLGLVGFSEGTSNSPITRNHGYDIIVSGVDGPNSFTDYSAHPFASGRPAIEVVAPGERFPDGLYSTASGRYQIILPTWEELATKLNLSDFSPASQDAACVQLLAQHGAVNKVIAGDIQGAITACSGTWASFPGSTAGQGGKTMGTLLDKYSELSAA
jgi:muramidase (phage lysozyme)